eukprot:715279-Pyramimonas_sp.AAC.1
MLRRVSWGHLGPPWGSLRAILDPWRAVLGLSWTAWKTFRMAAGRFWSPPGDFGRPEDRCLGASRSRNEENPKLIPNSLKNMFNQMSFPSRGVLGGALGGLLVRFGAIFR